MATRDLGRWEPLPVGEVVALFSGFTGLWWLAGGYAIELAVGRPVRAAHADVDVGVPRTDHLAVHDVLQGWELWAADPPGSLRRWPRGQQLARDVHDVWCRPQPACPWAMQIVVDETDGDQWVSRRDPTVRRPIASVIDYTARGIPYLTPAVQLYYKSARQRPKDDVDFKAALPVLRREERRWLHARISETGATDHPWLADLSDA